MDPLDFVKNIGFNLGLVAAFSFFNQPIAAETNYYVLESSETATYRRC